MIIEIDDELYEKWLKPALAEMQEMYADQDRDNWWDADDIAKDVAEYIAECIAEQGE